MEIFEKLTKERYIKLLNSRLFNPIEVVILNFLIKGYTRYRLRKLLKEWGLTMSIKCLDKIIDKIIDKIYIVFPSFEKEFAKIDNKFDDLD